MSCERIAIRCANLRMTPRQSLHSLRGHRRRGRGTGVLCQCVAVDGLRVSVRRRRARSRRCSSSSTARAIGHRRRHAVRHHRHGEPRQVGACCAASCVARCRRSNLTVHLHDTRGMGAGQRAGRARSGHRALRCIARRTGRLSVRAGRERQRLHRGPRPHVRRMGLDTGVDLDALLAVAGELPDLVGHAVPGQVLRAGKADRRHALFASSSR